MEFEITPRTLPYFLELERLSSLLNDKLFDAYRPVALPRELLSFSEPLRTFVQRKRQTLQGLLQNFSLDFSSLLDTLYGNFATNFNLELFFASERSLKRLGNPYFSSLFSQYDPFEQSLPLSFFSSLDTFLADCTESLPLTQTSHTAPFTLPFTCFYTGEDDGEILIDGVKSGDLFLPFEDPFLDARTLLESSENDTLFALVNTFHDWRRDDSTSTSDFNLYLLRALSLHLDPTYQKKALLETYSDSELLVTLKFDGRMFGDAKLVFNYIEDMVNASLLRAYSSGEAYSAKATSNRRARDLIDETAISLEEEGFYPYLVLETLLSSSTNREETAQALNGIYHTLSSLLELSWRKSSRY